MAFSKGRSSITLQDILSKVSEADIAAKYLNITKIPCIISSPIRVDKKPSFGLYSSDGEKIKWIDFATKERGGIFDLLVLMWHCSFKDMIEIIGKDFIDKSNTLVHSCAPNSIRVLAKSKQIDLLCKIRDWESYDVKYWESYGVPLKWLKYAEVYPISHKIIVKDNKTYVFGADKYAYAFVEHKEGKSTIKIYQPFNKNGFKWSNKHDRSVVSLWTKVPEYGDKIVICSSLKDALCLWANTGIPALAIQGEGYAMSNTAIENLKSRYKNIYILLDNDDVGLEDGVKLSTETGFTNLVLPKFEGGKDLSDLYKSQGIDKFKSIIINLLSKEK